MTKFMKDDLVNVSQEGVCFSHKQYDYHSMIDEVRLVGSFQILV